MTTERIKEIQMGTAYPESVSVKQALLQVWNECAQEQSPAPDGWVRVEDGLPEIIEDKDCSENVFAICNNELMVMCRVWVDAEPESGYVWANCYGDINGEGIWDADYTPTKWMLLPKLPSPPKA